MQHTYIVIETSRSTFATSRLNTWNIRLQHVYIPIATYATSRSTFVTSKKTGSAWTWPSWWGTTVASKLRSGGRREQRPRRRPCWSCSKFTAGYWSGFWRSEAEARRRRLGPDIYAHARVSWRLDYLVSRHRRVTPNSWDSEIVAGWCPWFFSFALKGFST
jgi:hypothetical protein